MKDLKKGFTLIELLVVIAIIAILAAILFPVFAQAREKARQSNCLSNMKNVGMAVLLYVDDNHETFPKGDDTGYDGWAKKALPYTGIKAEGGTWNNVTVFQCPCDDGYADWMQTNGHIGRNSYVGNIYIFRCGMNQYLADDTSQNVLKLARVKQASNTIMLAETWKYGLGTINYSVYDTAFPPINPYQTYICAFGNKREEVDDPNCEAMNGYHNGNDNWVFCDGHAASLKPHETVDGKNLWALAK